MKNIILVIFTTVLLYNCSTEDNYKIDIPKIGKTEPKSFIVPPFGTCIEFITLTINPNKDTLIQFQSRAAVPVGFPDKIKFPKDNHHSFWGVTMKGELAIIDNFKLTKQNLERNLVEMKFSTQDVTKSSPEDISQKIRASF